MCLKTLEEAYQLATSGRKGPVWIDVPLDIQGAPLKPFSIPHAKNIVKACSDKPIDLGRNCGAYRAVRTTNIFLGSWRKT